MFDIRKRRTFQVGDLMGLHSVRPTQFDDLELSGFQELGIFRGNPDLGPGHPFFKNRDPMGVIDPLMGGFE